MILYLLAIAGCRNAPPTPVQTTPPAPPLPADTVQMPDVTVVDAAGVQGPVTVLLSAGRILALSSAPIDGVEVLEEARGKFLVPGLIDPHVHLFLSGASVYVGDTLKSALRSTVAHGVTTVVDAGSPLHATLLRDRIRSGGLLGPDLLVLGPMVTERGSHPCELVVDEDYCSFATNPDEGRSAGLARVAAGTDGLKLAIADAAFTPWPTDRLDAAVASATILVSPPIVYAHVDSPEDVAIALDVGAFHLAHPVFGGVVDAALADRVATEAASVHTTLGAFSGLTDVLAGQWANPPGLDPRVQASWDAVRANPDGIDPVYLAETVAWARAAEDSVIALWAADAPILPASDAGYTFVPHGAGFHRELERLVSLGFSPHQLLNAATNDAAVALGLFDRGLVEPGYRADLLVLDGDPTASVAELARPSLVLLAGRPYRPDALWDADPLIVADQAENGTFCLDARDCVSDACDQVTHRCVVACTAPFASADDTCGPEASCVLAEVVSGDPVCRTVRSCDWRDNAGCAGEPYRERCVPLDLDTSACFPAGPRAAGQACDPYDTTPGTTRTCGPGLICTLDDRTCHVPCEEAGPPCAQNLACDTFLVGSTPWFGVCR